MKKTFAALLLGVLASASLQAHPHAYINCKSSLLTDEQGITAVRVTWTYDEAFSKAVAEKADRNHDGRLEAMETGSLPGLTFAELKEVESTLELKVNGQVISLEKNSNSVASYNGKNLEFMADVPLKIAVTDKNAEVKVSLVDPSYFCEVAISDDLAPLALSGRFAVSSQVKTNMDESFYYGSLHPQEILLNAKPTDKNTVAISASQVVPTMADSDVELPQP